MCAERITKIRLDVIFANKLSIEKLCFRATETEEATEENEEAVQRNSTT